MAHPAPFPIEGQRSFLTSEALHARVRDFAQKTAAGSQPTESFERLALDIARFQRAESEGLGRLWPESPSSLEELEALPADAFRFGRVALYPEALDVARFRTSGTTRSESGLHPARTLRTYDELTLLLARGSLFRGLSRAVTVALCDIPEEPPSSSLNYMMRRFIDEFDGRSHDQRPKPETAMELGRACFLMSSIGLDLKALERAARVAKLRKEPLVVLGAAFAFASLIEALGGDPLSSDPPEVRLMITGGFKGRRIEMSEAELRRELSRAFGRTRTHILGEYGMTELTSQLYEAWSSPEPHFESSEQLLPAFSGGGQAGRYVAPPWLQVTAVDPATGKPVPAGETGVARFVDLGNVDSVLVVQTEDLIVQGPRGIELRGRRERAPARGCSLPYEGLLASRSKGER
jgi:hypothetical protein